MPMKGKMLLDRALSLNYYSVLYVLAFKLQVNIITIHNIFRMLF